MANKTTSRKAASAASAVLRDRRTSKTSKTAAASALAQRSKNCLLYTSDAADEL